MSSLSEEFSISQETLNNLSNKTISDFTPLFEQSIANNITDGVKVLFGWATLNNISDIHFEPGKENVDIRFRIDGLLTDAGSISHDIYKRLAQRLRLLATIKLNIGNKAQDGSFVILTGGSEIECRISLVPANYGESSVIRILNPKNIFSVEDLGLRPALQQKFERSITSPHGLILVTGPTGSGKTTTLYAILQKIKSPSIKIITIEDPIEYRLEDITQTEVDQSKGYTFSEGLKSIVRQDPDVILVGEIRDEDTCKTAIQASLTGHLVLATLHANDAIGAINRLIALGAKPENIAPALTLVIAQRLSRKLCESCAKEKQITENDFVQLTEWLKDSPIEHPELTPNTTLLYPERCDNCSNTGYKGRIGIYEMFFPDDELRDLIISSKNIKGATAIKEMASLKHDGAVKILSGITSVEEIRKIIG